MSKTTTEATPEGRDSSESKDGAPAAGSRVPAYCSVCGRPLNRTVTEVSGGFDPESGAARRTRERTTLECSQLFHDRLESFDGGKYQPVR